MQSTYYRLIASKDGVHWIELTPSPRSPKGGLAFYKTVEDDGQYEFLKLERITHRVEILRSNRRAIK